MLAGGLLVVLVIAGCGGGGGSQAPSQGGTTSTVDVTLQEWAVVPTTATATAGDVTFDVTNTGPEDVHEFVILQTDLAPDALPTDDTGAVSEEGEGIVVVDEIEDIAVGANQSLTAALAAGKYVLICNIYSAEENEAHYQMGMRTAFTVE
jgi:uncharacterized cupredoxin-like copper-binding protein